MIWSQRDCRVLGRMAHALSRISINRVVLTLPNLTAISTASAIVSHTWQVFCPPLVVVVLEVVGPVVGDDEVGEDVVGLALLMRRGLGGGEGLVLPHKPTRAQQASLL
jgi:hypothetical protein